MKKALLLCALGTAFLAAQAAHADTVSGTATLSDSTNNNNLYIGDVVNNDSCLGFCFALNVPMGGSTTYTDFISFGSDLLPGNTATKTESDVIDLTFDIYQPGGGSGTLGGGVSETQTSQFYGLYDTYTGQVTWDNPLDITLSNGDTLAINLSDVTLSPAGLVCLGYQVCGSANATFTLDPPAATPEPGSLALLGTSVLGAAGLLRRKLSL